MNNILQITALFLAELGLGSAMMFPLMPVRITGKPFLRYYYGMILFVLVLFFACLMRLDQFHLNYVLAVGLGVWIWIHSFTQEYTREEEYLLWINAILSLGLLLIYASKFFFHEAEAFAALGRIVALVSSAVFLAFHIMNMVFGHWYLVNRKLPIEHLIRTTKYLILVTYVRVAVVLFAVTYAHAQMPADDFNRLIDFAGHGIFFWPRILAGLGLPLLVSHLAHSSAKIGSNQSATGIMYAGISFVIVGELIGIYLTSITGYMF